MQNRKRILVITRWLPNSAEPVKCVFTEHIINAQAQRHKFSFTVVSPIPYFPPIGLCPFKRYSRFKNVLYKENMSGYIIYRPKYFKLPFLFKRFEWYFYLSSVLRTIKRENIEFNLIHAHGIYPDGKVAVEVGEKFNRKVVLHVHESYLSRYSNNQLYLETLNKADKIIPVSHFQAKQIYKMYPEVMQRCKTIYNGVKLAEVPDVSENMSDIRRKNNKLLFVGNLIDTKGLDLLLIALKDLKQYNLSLDVIGSGCRLKEYRNNVKKYNLAERVKFLGELSNKEVLKKMFEYNFLILPSKYETFGIVLIEALSRGVPVIATDVGAVPEIVNSEEVGILVKSENPKSLAEGIKRALAKPWNREHIMKYAETFAIERTVEKIENVYEEVMEY